MISLEAARKSFVTVSDDGVIDISHESLIRQWPRLRDWVGEEAASRDTYHRLAESAGRWRRGEAALMRHPDLQLAVNWWTDKPAQRCLGSAVRLDIPGRSRLPGSEPQC